MKGTVPARAGVDTYLSRFTVFLEERAGAEPDWLRCQREEAMARFAARGLPGPGDEEWKYTSVSAIAGTPFARATAADPGPAVSQLLDRALVDGEAPRIVFVNGRFQPRLSVVGRLPDRVQVDSLAAALRRDADAVHALLSPEVFSGGHAFGDLNDAFLEDGAVVRIEEGQTVEAPIQLVFLNRAGTSPEVSHPRVLVQAAAGSQARLVEIHAGDGEMPYLANAVTDVLLDDGAGLSHVTLERQATAAFHVGLLRVRQGRDSRYTATSLSLGAGWARHDPRVLLDAEGAECSLGGLYVLDGSRHADHHTFVDHVRPRTISRQLYKGILDDRSRGVFFGRVIVRPKAQKISARQTNNNLLMSSEALANSTPQLEIHADDVQARHGSTIGQLDEEMLFYLRSRGLDRDTARMVLVYAFAGDVLENMGIPGVKERVQRVLFSEAVS